jgi:hypothetical protein
MNGAGKDRLVPNPKARLRDQFHEVARFKHLSLRTEQTYWDWVVRYRVSVMESVIVLRYLAGRELNRQPDVESDPVAWRHSLGLIAGKD